MYVSVLASLRPYAARTDIYKMYVIPMFRNSTDLLCKRQDTKGLHFSYRHMVENMTRLKIVSFKLMLLSSLICFRSYVVDFVCLTF